MPLFAFFIWCKKSKNNNIDGENMMKTKKQEEFKKFKT